MGSGDVSLLDSIGARALDGSISLSERELAAQYVLGEGETEPAQLLGIIGGPAASIIDFG